MKKLLPFVCLSLIAIGATVDDTVKAAGTELGGKFSVEVVEDLFVVASNDRQASTARAIGTVKNVYHALYKDFMKRKPTEPLKVYLFKDKGTYEGYNRKAYGRDPTTPFGFYMSGERKMVMNISTGTGTLAHEMVHPLIATDFPGVPSWFNEGFASLFEQSTTLDDGSMKGLVNWRLPGLQKALKNGDEVSLKEVMETSTDEFYSDSGIHYAIARYLCLYLQEKSLLTRFYKEFRDSHEDDPTGVKSLEKVTGQPLDQLEKSWKPWVKTLKYPN